MRSFINPPSFVDLRPFWPKLLAFMKNPV